MLKFQFVRVALKNFRKGEKLRGISNWLRERLLPQVEAYLAKSELKMGSWTRLVHSYSPLNPHVQNVVASEYGKMAYATQNKAKYNATYAEAVALGSASLFLTVR